MCTKCDEQIKLAIDHVVVAALKLARLTNVEYRVSSLKGLLFTILPVTSMADVLDESLVAIVRATSTADELKTQVSKYMDSLVKRDLADHGAAKVEFVDKTDDAYVAPPNVN